MHVFSSLGRGGAERRTVDVADSVPYRFAFLAASGRRGPLDTSIRSAGHLVARHNLMRITGLVQIVRLIRKERVRVVHSHLGAASGPIVLAAVVAGARTRIVHCRSDSIGGGLSLKKSVFLAISRYVVRLFATDIVGVSPMSLKGSGLVRGRWRQRARVIPNGLPAAALARRAKDARASRSLRQDRFTVLNIARREQSKNRPRALEVWSQVARQRTSTLVLIGSMTEDELSLATTIGNDPEVVAAGSRIEILGEVDDVPEQLGRADVLLVTSMREGLPGVVLEALACGTAVVATDLPGVRWISSQITGVAILSLDQTDTEWATAVINAPEDSERISLSFSRSEFQLDRAVEQHLKLWGLDYEH